MTKEQAAQLKEGDPVTYIPYHAKGNINHPACEKGHVTSVTDYGVFVRFKGGTPQRCDFGSLMKG